MEFNKTYGSPYDRGSADAFYRRGCKPHFYNYDAGISKRIEKDNMSPDELEAYYAGFEEETGSKF